MILSAERIRREMRDSSAQHLCTLHRLCETATLHKRFSEYGVVARLLNHAAGSLLDVAPLGPALALGQSGRVKSSQVQVRHTSGDYERRIHSLMQSKTDGKREANWHSPLVHHPQWRN